MNILIYVVDSSNSKIWGLTGKERLLRQILQIPGTTIIDGVDQVPEKATLILLHGDYLIDPRILKAMVNREQEFALVSGTNNRIVAVRISGKDARSCAQNLLQGKESDIRTGLTLITPEDLEIFYQDNIKKNDPPYLYHIGENNHTGLENMLFTSVYKSVTDLITKWVWPLPARWVTRLCIQAGLTPNQLTITGLVLVILATVAFWHGLYGTGLILAWLMTFLDTVDGKLARVTVTSSRTGHMLDHGMDIIHPPFWYLAWGLGLETSMMQDSTLTVLLWLMLAAYLGGRICELLFEVMIAPFAIFVWQPIDSFIRLITARRNPNLILLTSSWFAGRPDLGLWAVIIWHLVSTLILGIRLVQGWLQKHSHGPLQTWLNEIDPAKDRGKLAVRIFTKFPGIL